MTVTDRIVPLYVWFIVGFAVISILFSILNFGMNIVIMLTVKGFYISTWMLVTITLLMVGFCTAVGYFFEKFDIQNRIMSHQNQNMNPEIKQMCDDIREMKEWIGCGKKE